MKNTTPFLLVLSVSFILLFLSSLASAQVKIQNHAAAAKLPTNTTNGPGVRALITQNAVDYLSKVGSAYVRQQLPSFVLNIPDQSGSEDSIEWSITHIQAKNIQLPNDLQVLLNNGSITFGVSQVSAKITCDWDVKEEIWPHPSSSGGAEIDLTFNAVATIGLSVQNGRPQASSRSVNVQITKFDISFSGSILSWFYDLLSSLFSGPIKSLIENTAASAISSSGVAALNKILLSIPVSETIPHTNLTVNYALVEPETMATGVVGLGMNGTFYNAFTGHAFAGTPPALPTSDVNTLRSQLQFFISDYVFNGILFTVSDSGYLNITIKASDVPSSFPLQFNTSSWKYVIPELYSMYPNWLMQANMGPYPAPPVVTISSNGVAGKGNSLFNMFVISPQNGSLIPVFTLGLALSSQGKAILNGSVLSGQISTLGISLSLVRSNVGNFDVSALSKIAQFVATTVGVPLINKYLADGFTIPTFANVSLVNSTIYYNASYLTILANVSIDLGLQPSNVFPSWPCEEQEEELNGAHCVVSMQEREKEDTRVERKASKEEKQVRKTNKQSEKSKKKVDRRR
ncbi:hypothetical protein QOT17_016929 [Balamuthia mandrillaris]